MHSFDSDLEGALGLGSGRWWRGMQGDGCGWKAFGGGREGDGAGRGRRAEDVDGVAVVDFVVLAVEEEALVGVEVEFSDAEGDGFVVYYRLLVWLNARVDRVECGMIQVPAVWMRNCKFSVEIRRSMSGYCGGF